MGFGLVLHASWYDFDWFNVNKLTTLTGEPFKKASRFETAVSIRRWRLSFGAQAICGVIMQFFAARSGLLARIGSDETTSTAAAATLPLFSASAKSSSMIRGPRESLIMMTPSFIFIIECLFMIPCVSGKRGQ